MLRFRVERPTALLDFLLGAITGAKRSTVKHYLKFRSVTVNQRTVTHARHPLTPGDEVGVWTEKKLVDPGTYLEPGLKVVYEDQELIVAEKPAGLLTIATEKVKHDTAYYRLNEFLRARAELERARRRSRGPAPERKQIYIVHRLDRDVSGLLVFAKTPAAKTKLQNGWSAFEKRYAAVVHGKPERERGVIESHLRENARLLVQSAAAGAPGAKRAFTEYRVLRPGAKYSLLEIRLRTGRKHQIRVHLADLGHPVAGDDKYGRPDGAPRLCLHAAFLGITHPQTGKRMSFRSALPAAFETLLKIL